MVCGRVAQLVEQRPFKAWVAGSNPAALTKLPPNWIQLPEASTKLVFGSARPRNFTTIRNPNRTLNITP
jgi:hypothetical protein